MDWLHCNFCFRSEGLSFAVSSCGHISCESCVNPNQCNICGASCSYIPICDKIAAFQRRQKDRATAFFKHKALELEARLKEVMEQSYREVSDLRRQNAELKKPLSQRRVSPGNFHSNSHSSSSHLYWQTPGSAFSVSSLSSLHDPTPRTPTEHLGTPHRYTAPSLSVSLMGLRASRHHPVSISPTGQTLPPQTSSTSALGSHCSLPRLGGTSFQTERKKKQGQRVPNPKCPSFRGKSLS
ncbi:hypothetical protein JZ751_024194 [Albula glossodonta]|uniref:Uncharacterized protein n=1 Tax=Albula glossodonta TaxID=121402 RepID=A0A8T2MSA0_9TELE|nr:hypothetical protein JZ751_024194 [Albula glossodonta]